jgi:NDP-sugar pyrophosphorylase family protein
LQQERERPRPADLAGVVLSAGAGTRLRPLTYRRPKVLCPVDNVPLVDWALDRLTPVTASVAVNVSHGRDLLVAHLEGRVHLSFEEPEPLGTAGALGALRDWIGGRPVVVVNGDTWCPGSVTPLLDGWDGARCRVLLAAEPGRTAAFAAGVRVAGALLPWPDVAALEPEPSGLFDVWTRAAAAGRLDAVAYTGPFADCGTPAAYLDANLTASGGESVIGDGAVVEGEVIQSVVWPGAIVRRGERLVRSVRAGTRLTVAVR